MLQYNFIIDILNGGVDMEAKVIPKNILKIQQKLSTYEIGSRNYKKYQKILQKHIKKHMMKQRTNSNIKTIEIIKQGIEFSLSTFKKC